MEVGPLQDLTTAWRFSPPPLFQALDPVKRGDNYNLASRAGKRDFGKCAPARH